MDRLYFACCAALIAIGASILLTACGGGDCDDTCKADLREATALPVNCAASGVCK